MRISPRPAEAHGAQRPSLDERRSSSPLNPSRTSSTRWLVELLIRSRPCLAALSPRFAVARTAAVILRRRVVFVPPADLPRAVLLRVAGARLPAGFAGA